MVLLKHNKNYGIYEGGLKMKKRIFMLLMAMMMVLGMSFVSMADEDVWYEIDFYQSGSYPRWVSMNDFYGYSGSKEIEKGFFKISGDQVEFRLIVEEFGELNFKLEKLPVHNGYNPHIMVEFEGNDVRELQIVHATNLFFYDQHGKDEVGLKYLENVENCEFYLFGSFHEVEESAEPVIHQITAPFTGVAESDTGSYTLALAGYYTAELTDGTHVLSASDITAQTIAIVAYNKANGVKRVMRETTIEEMTVTVSGGTVTEYIIRGRVQTDGGTLDRYTATINP